ncbi:MAG: galactose oxidase, partial [Flavobacteriaceae bacterium]|nr:galactose oxidase [Flavobacteriaceae bacterium]
YHSVVSSGDKIYISGGKRLSSNKRLQYLDETIEIYDQNSNNVIEDRVNPHKAVNALSLSYKDKILLIGGSIKESKNGIKTFSDEIHFQNLKTGFWYKLTTMREGKEVKGVLAGDKIYLIGGFNGRSLTTIETFDLLTDKWETVGELNKASASPGIAISDTTIFIFDNGKISTYNTRTKVLNDYLINIPLSGANMHYNNGKLYVIGGYTKNSYSKLPSSAVYSIDLKEFDMTRIYRSKKL